MRWSVYLAALWVAACQSAPERQPIIDMHRHASLAPSVDTANEIAEMAAELDRHHVVLAALSITSVEQLDSWLDHGQDRFLLSAMLPCPKNLAEPWFVCFPSNSGLPDIGWLREQVKAGRIRALHELMFNYDGSLPDDPKMTPYWELAFEFDLPVGVHTWSGPPPGASVRKDPNCCPEYDGAIGNPANLRPVLERYPGLRIWLQHVGSDGNRVPLMWEETLSLLSDYPNVYVDLSITNSVLPIDDYKDALRRLIDAGFEDRIMFGSDNLSIAMIVDRLNSIEELSEEQRRAIFYGNAARFLKLSD